MKVKLSKNFRCTGMVLTGVFAILLFALQGCSKSTPACDSGKTIKTVVNIVSQDFKNDLAAIVGVGGPGMELTDEEWKSIRAGMVIDLENIREHSFDEAECKRKCAANLMIVSGGSKELIPVTYISEINKDTGELKVTLSGLEEYKKSKVAPPMLPE
ncbi:MAG: hypothetical protein AB1480_10160 [Nitrospirota bacterium]